MYRNCYLSLKADDILCELQCIMREGLSVCVEAEMRLAYEDLW
jgi:hypothetical protein